MNQPLAPHNVEAEEAVLGSLLIGPEMLVFLKTFLFVEDFYIERYGWVYQIICELSEQGVAPDMITISDALENKKQLEEFGGAAKLTELLIVTPTHLNAEHYGKIVADKAERRRLLKAAGNITALAYDETVENLVIKAEEEVIAVHRNATSKDFKNLDELTDEQLDLMEGAKEGGRVGISTGLTDLDKLIGGLQNSDMVVMAGRPGMGKTSLALSIIKGAAQNYGKHVGVFSLEMGDIQLMQRLLSAETGIKTQAIRQAQLRDEQWPFFIQGIQSLSAVPIWINDQVALSIAELRSKARLLHAKVGLDLLLVDYLQLMDGSGKKGENRQQEISLISRGLKALARELNIPVIALSQLSRQVEGRTDKRPVLSDLRESGAIEQDSDLVIFIYRDEVYNPDTEFKSIAELILSKHRHGPTGSLSVYFKKEVMQFVDLVIKQEPLDDFEQEYNALTYDISGF